MKLKYIFSVLALLTCLTSCQETTYSRTTTNTYKAVHIMGTNALSGGRDYEITSYYSNTNELVVVTENYGTFAISNTNYILLRDADSCPLCDYVTGV